MGERNPHGRWVVPEFHIKPGKIDHFRVIQPMRAISRRLISEYISVIGIGIGIQLIIKLQFLRRSAFRIGIMEIFADIPSNTIDVLQPFPMIMHAQTPIISSFERDVRLNNPVRPIEWKAVTIQFSPHLVTRISPLLPRIPSLQVTKDRPNYQIPYIIKSCNRIIVYFGNE